MAEETDIFRGGAGGQRFCPNCGAEASSGVFCSACGQPLNGPPSAVPEASLTDPDAAAEPKLSADAQPENRKGGRRPLAIALVLVVVIGIGTAGFLLSRHPSNGSATSTSQASFGAPCSQNPACSGSGNTTPEQKFVNDVSQMTLSNGGTVGTDIDSGQINSGDVGGLGDTICNSLTQASNTVSEYTYLSASNRSPYFPRLRSQIGWNLTVAQGEQFVSTAIKDICPTYQSDIPFGMPGAS